MKKIGTTETAADLADLKDAIADLATETQKGTVIDDAIIREIAEDYGLNPALLKRKFEEQYPKGVGEPLPTMQENVKRKVAELTEEYVRRYRIDPDRVADFIHRNGIRYTGICRLGRNKVLAVSHKDGMGYHVRGENIEKMLWEPGQKPNMNQVPDTD